MNPTRARNKLDNALGLLAQAREALEETKTPGRRRPAPEPQPKPEPDPPPRRRPKPSSGYPDVTVEWDDGQRWQLSRDHDAVEALPGIWILPAHSKCLAPVIVAESHGVSCALIGNLFSGGPGVKVGGFEVQWPDDARDRNPKVFGLWPGHSRAIVHFSPGWGDGMTFDPPARKEALPNITDWMSRRHGFSGREGWQQYGGANPNIGGGQHVYPNNEWWMNSKEGIGMACGVMLGYLHRAGWMRFDRSAWADGRLEPATVPAGFSGLSHTRGGDEAQLPGYTGGGNPPYGSLDWQHMSRILHITRALAEQGFSIAKLILRMIAEDARLCFVEPSGRTGGNYVLWSCEEILAHYPGGRGSAWAGREFAWAMHALADAEIILGGFREPLEKMVEAALHLFDHDRSCLHLIPRWDPIHKHNGKPVEIAAWGNKFDRKTHANGDQLQRPHGDESVQVTFEEYFNILAIGRAADALRHGGGPTDLDGMLGKMIRELGAFPPEIKVPDAPEYNSTRTAIWQHQGWPFLKPGFIDLVKEAGKAGPWDSSNPCSAAHPDLWPSS